MMHLRCCQHLGLLCAMTLAVWPGKGLAVETSPPQKDIVPVDVGAQGTVRPPSDSPRAARVRISLALTTYDKLPIQNAAGKTKIIQKALPPTRHSLRARIERTNHFYVGPWHIETIPVAFDRKTLNYAVGLRFSKKYGDGWDLEEYVGRLDLKGRLKGKDFSYDLIGSESAKFFSPRGEPLLDVEAGLNPLKETKPANSGQVATEISTTPTKSR